MKCKVSRDGVSTLSSFFTGRNGRLHLRQSWLWLFGAAHFQLLSVTGKFIYVRISLFHHMWYLTSQIMIVGAKRRQSTGLHMFIVWFQFAFFCQIQRCLHPKWQNPSVEVSQGFEYKDWRSSTWRFKLGGGVCWEFSITFPLFCRRQ